MELEGPLNSHFIHIPVGPESLTTSIYDNPQIEIIKDFNWLESNYNMTS